MATILIIEDNQVLRSAYQQILKKSGHTVAVASNGQEGLAEAERKEPGIIFLDLLMPTMSGLEFLRQYDVIHKHPNVKVIVISNLDSDAEADEARALGAYKYILKAHATPVQLSILVDKAAQQKLER